MSAPLAPDRVLRDRIMQALAAAPMIAGISSPATLGQLADAVLAIGTFDVVLTDGLHIYQSNACRHGDPDSCETHDATCTGCGAACRHTFADLAAEVTA